MKRDAFMGSMEHAMFFLSGTGPMGPVDQSICQEIMHSSLLYFVGEYVDTERGALHLFSRMLLCRPV